MKGKNAKLMANQEQLDILNQGVEIWNQCRKQHPDIRPDLSNEDLNPFDHPELPQRDRRRPKADFHEVNLSGADLTRVFLVFVNLTRANFSKANLMGAHLQHCDLSEANLMGANLSYAHFNDVNLTRANLSEADLSGATFNIADLREADLRRANLSKADLRRANLSKVDVNWEFDLRISGLSGTGLSGANLSGANLRGTKLEIKDLREAILREANLCGHNFNNVDFSGWDLSGVNLNETSLIKTNFSHANLSNCSIYGIAAWDIQLDEQTAQKNLTITPPGQPAITVDNLKIAQFIYLLLNNAEIREVIDTIGQKGVLILGRFTPERKVVLDALREKLRSLNFLPIVFDFEHPTAHDFTETIMTLAGLSCFIIADITNPKSSPLELQATVPNYMTPFVPIIQEGERPFAMFTDLQNKYRDWVLDTLLYDTPSNLINVLERAIVRPALERQTELTLIKAQRLRTRHIKDYL